MTITATRVARTHRPGAVVATIVLLIFRNRQSANVDELDLMRW